MRILCACCPGRRPRTAGRDGNERPTRMARPALPLTGQEAEERTQIAPRLGNRDRVYLLVLTLVDQAVAVLADEVGVVALVVPDPAPGCEAVQEVFRLR